MRTRALRRVALSSGLAAVSAVIICSGIWIHSEWRESWIVANLARGGYTIYLRHADRNSGTREKLTADSPMDAFKDCDRQRNLTKEGRRDARQIGEVFRDWKVPIGKVIALPLCRTRETASLAFGPNIVLDPRLYNVDYLRDLISQAPQQGNTVVVDTEDQVYRLVGTKLKPGEAAVFLADAKGGFRYLGDLDQADLDP